MSISTSPFPKLSQVWRLARLAGTGFGTTALAGLAHIAWADRTALAAVAVGAVEVAYRRAFPSGKLSGQLASLVAAYRQVTAAAAAKPAAPVAPVLPAVGVPETPVAAS